MTHEAFVQAINDMKGLQPNMVQSLLTLAPQLTEKQREEAVVKLTPLNAEIFSKQKELEELVASQEQALKTFKKTRMPEIKAIVTEREQRDAEAIINAAIAP